jgi:hypothetical protein
MIADWFVQAEGLAAISRGLSEAMPPVGGDTGIRPQRGRSELDSHSWHPAGVR